MIDTLIQTISRFAASCDSGNFFGFPTWYKYLDGRSSPDNITGSVACTPIINGLSDVWLIVAAVIEIILRIAVFLAIGFVVWGGIQFVIGQGEPDRVSAARDTILHAVVGLVVTIVATAVVSFAAGRFVSS